MKKEDILKVIISLRDLKVNISKKRIGMCIKSLKNVTKSIENLVYWSCYAEANERHGLEEKREGLITKDEYQRILKLDKSLDIQLDEISKYVNMCCELNDFYFSDEQDEIIDFYNSGKCDFPLMDYIECYE